MKFDLDGPINDELVLIQKWYGPEHAQGINRTNCCLLCFCISTSTGIIVLVWYIFSHQLYVVFQELGNQV